MGAPNVVIHYRTKIKEKGKDEHSNVKPLCSNESLRLLGEPSVGDMMPDIEAVTCLACKMLYERKNLKPVL